MSTGSNVLKEFLVKIGFKVDETKYRHFQEAMRATAKNAVEMSKTALAATAVMGEGLKTVARQMEGLYFASRRTGASAGELSELGFAAEQIGISAERARGAVEGLAAARRTNPGLNGILSGLGIDPRQTDNARVLLQLLTKLRAMPYYQGAQVAQMFGLDEHTFQMLEQGLPEMQKYLALREKMFAAAGINPQEMAGRSHEFMTHFRVFEAALGNLADIIAYRLMPWGEKVIDWLTGVVMWFTRADKATDGWSSKILGVLSALAGGNLIKGALSTLGKLFGGGLFARGAAVAAGGETVAGEAAGTGLLGTVGLPVLIATVVAAVAAWMLTHPEQVKKGLQTAKHALDTFDAKAHQALDPFIGHAKTSLIDMVKRFEGHVKGFGTYRDIAGKLTAGYGHLMRPGERVPHDQQSADALLNVDLAKAVAAVADLVKVKLNGNQRDALTDFEFNVGRDKFAHSTLLRKLNAGDYNGAANEFQRWNHALVDGHLQTVAALTARRAAETQLFRTPDKTVNIEQKNDYHITSTDPKGAAAEIERRQGRVNADLARNFAGAYE